MTIPFLTSLSLNIRMRDGLKVYEIMSFRKTNFWILSVSSVTMFSFQTGIPLTMFFSSLVFKIEGKYILQLH